MNKYRYTATDKTGKRIKGNFVAENEAEMKEMLLKAGYYVVSYRQVSSRDLSSFFSISGRVKASELSTFCNQFSAMISAGISIIDAVDVCANQDYSGLLKRALVRIKEDLRQGSSLSRAMARFPIIFPPFFTNMVFVGEAAGCLDVVLKSVAEYYVFEEATKKKIRGALAYPAILFTLLIVVVVVMMVYVIPTFIDSFSKMNVPMPALTMSLFYASVFFRRYGAFVLLGLVVLIGVLWGLRYVQSVRLFYDKLKVTLPLFKKINMALFTSRFCRSLSLLLSSGSDSLSALESVRKTITNRYLDQQFERVINNVRMGMSLSSALRAEMNVSPILIQMIIVGERTGELDIILEKTSPYFSDRAQTALNSITAVLQPTIMILLGVSIAILFVAVYSPILSMIQNLNPQ